MWDSTACRTYGFETHFQKFKYVFQLRLVRLLTFRETEQESSQVEEHEKVLANTSNYVYVNVPVNDALLISLIPAHLKFSASCHLEVVFHIMGHWHFGSRLQIIGMDMGLGDYSTLRKRNGRVA